MRKAMYLLMLIGLVLTTACKKSSCSNHVKDGKEEGIDCGGTCMACSTPAENNTTSTPLSALIGTWYFNKSSGFSKSPYSNDVLLELSIHANNDLAKVELTDTLNSDSTQKCYGTFYYCNYPMEDYWTYDSSAFTQIKTGTYPLGFKIVDKTPSSLVLNIAYYNLYYSKSVSSYKGTTPQVQVEFKILSNLPANALVADGDTLSAGQTLWSKTYTGSGNQAQFSVNIDRPSNSSATGNVTFQMFIKDINGEILAESDVVSRPLEGYPPTTSGDGSLQGNLHVSYNIKWD